MRNNIVEYLSNKNPVRAAIINEACRVYVNTMLKNEAEYRQALKHGYIAPDEWFRCVRELEANLAAHNKRQ